MGVIVVNIIFKEKEWNLVVTLQKIIPILI